MLSKHIGSFMVTSSNKAISNDDMPFHYVRLKAI